MNTDIIIHEVPFVYGGFTCLNFVFEFMRMNTDIIIHEVICIFASFFSYFINCPGCL
jgi:hypothetical protein